MNEIVKLDPAEKELFRDSVRKFLENVVKPHYEQWENDGIWPRDLWRQLGENGFLCVDMPGDYGGYDASFEMSCVIVEELSSAGYAAIASGVSVHSDIVAPYILHLGSEWVEVFRLNPSHSCSCGTKHSTVRVRPTRRPYAT